MNIRFLCTVFLLAIALFPSQSRAQDNMAALHSLPVLHEGRVKPMESFASAMLKQFSGRDDDAMEWLVMTVFDPAAAEKTPVIKVRNPALVTTLGLSSRPNRLYSYTEMMQALQKSQDLIVSILKEPQEKWTKEQIALIELQSNVAAFGDLMSSFSLFLPLSINAKENGLLDPYHGQVLTYYKLREIRDALHQSVQQTVQTKGEDFTRYDDQEQNHAALLFYISELERSGARSDILKLFPSENTVEWFSPWEAYRAEGFAGQKEMLDTLETIILSFHQDKPETFNEQLNLLNVQIREKAGGNLREGALKAERFYNFLSPFRLSFGFYALAFIFLGVGFISGRKNFNAFSYSALLTGVLVQAAGLGLRVYILERPPVSTLYESIMFVGLVAVLYMLYAYFKDRQIYWLYLSAGLGMVIQIVGFSHDTGGDNLMMLSAVLNTNFWLATHVICITAAYAFCIVTSALAHFALFKEDRSDLFSKIKFLALLSLLLSATGTVLGGIWADQSWGRFWGWDPKENGALLICLWLIWVLHGQISGQMRKVHVLAGLAYLSVIVALSWFGVNLLSVGLHSYGFTDSAAWILGLFTAGETLFIGFLLLKRRKGVYV